MTNNKGRDMIDMSFQPLEKTMYMHLWTMVPATMEVGIDTVVQ